MNTKVWNVMYAPGNTERVVGDGENPQTRNSALAAAAIVEKNGWRVWVEHSTTGERLFESANEKANREAVEAASRI